MSAQRMCFRKGNDGGGVFMRCVCALLEIKSNTFIERPRAKEKFRFAYNIYAHAERVYIWCSIARESLNIQWRELHLNNARNSKEYGRAEPRRAAHMRMNCSISCLVRGATRHNAMIHARTKTICDIQYEAENYLYFVRTDTLFTHSTVWQKKNIIQNCPPAHANVFCFILSSAEP